MGTAQAAGLVVRASDDALRRLAVRHGVRTSYDDWQGRPVEVPGDTVRRVLAAMGVTSDPRAPRAPHRSARRRRVPRRLKPPDALGRGWGWMVQLYALRSAESWGIGDFGDLSRLVVWAAADGADTVMVNPMHAPTPVSPIEPSPYLPSSRRFVNPIYLRIGDVPECAHERRPRAAALSLDSPFIDHDRVWAAKLRALERGWRLPATPERAAAFAAFRADRGPALEQFATFCALAEAHGRAWRDWPARLRKPESGAVERERRRLRDRVEFHCWLQWLCDEQLAAVQRRARAAGMAVGVVHDLAVGVDPDGADAWSMQDMLAADVTVGAPPDSFNQQGQDWRQPPFRPDRLAATGHSAWREIVTAVLRHGGGIRVDHIAGLFRLYWIPDGQSPRAGTYVDYDADAMLDVLVEEANRRGAVVIGENLGTVEGRVNAALRRRGILGSAVLWFERDAAGRAKRADGYDEEVCASVSTHDLPTAAGFLRGEQVRVRRELALLDDPAAEAQQAAAERDDVVDVLRAEGLVGPRARMSSVVTAMHAHLARTPARLVLASPSDAVGDLRQPNLPGTRDEYPNWRLPLARPLGRSTRPVSLDEFCTAGSVRRIVAVLRAARGQEREVPSTEVDR